MLPLILVTMTLQTGVMWRHGDMLQRQNDLISEIATNRREHDDEPSAKTLELAAVIREHEAKLTQLNIQLEQLDAERKQQMKLSVRQQPSQPPSEPQSTLPRQSLTGIEINPATILATIVIIMVYSTRQPPPRKRSAPAPTSPGSSHTRG